MTKKPIENVFFNAPTVAELEKDKEDKAAEKTKSCPSCGGCGRRRDEDGYLLNCFECKGSGVVSDADVRGRSSNLVERPTPNRKVEGSSPSDPKGVSSAASDAKEKPSVASDDEKREWHTLGYENCEEEWRKRIEVRIRELDDEKTPLTKYYTKEDREMVPKWIDELKTYKLDVAIRVACIHVSGSSPKWSVQMGEDILLGVFREKTKEAYRGLLSDSTEKKEVRRRGV